MRRVYRLIDNKQPPVNGIKMPITLSPAIPVQIPGKPLHRLLGAQYGMPEDLSDRLLQQRNQARLKGNWNLSNVREDSIVPISKAYIPDSVQPVNIPATGREINKPFIIAQRIDKLPDGSSTRAMSIPS